MTGIAEDGTDQGVWVTMTKPMDNGSKSELKFRMTSEAAAALRELISEALNYPHNVESIRAEINL